MEPNQTMVEVEDILLTIEYYYFPAEKETQIAPGYPAEVEIVSIFLTSDQDETNILSLLGAKLIEHLEEKILLDKLSED